MLFLLIDSPQKLKLENICGTLIVLVYGSRSSFRLKRICSFYQELQTDDNTSKDI